MVFDNLFTNIISISLEYIRLIVANIFLYIFLVFTDISKIEEP